MKTLFKVYTIGLSTKIPWIKEPKDSLFPEFLWPGRDLVLHSVLEFVVRADAFHFHAFFKRTKRIEIAWRYVRALMWIIKLVPFEVDQFHVCEPAEV
ncbi:hypothetical protein TNIN_152631 [Trichonephila inaurata madagascariensis]|uniref:Uncharacterized protein n=1 Tax=Trichonephila inaurata madagascariensis TaxID=2747483 RepID=A0A8X6ITF2_9ARAC|nr:hypothetical protein TNIN_152631 [Trichonephila inaurata madagascariensis]